MTPKEAKRLAKSLKKDQERMDLYVADATRQLRVRLEQYLDTGGVSWLLEDIQAYEDLKKARSLIYAFRASPKFGSREGWDNGFR